MGVIMDNKGVLEKGIISVLGTWISNRFGLLLPALGLLIFLMMTDYISGLLAAKKESYENPYNCEYGLSSKKSILGIYKKIGYMLTILVTVCIDYLIYKFAKEIGLEIGTNTIFGLLVTVWFIINELISILENVGRMGTEIPNFLRKILAELKNNIDNNQK
jgi:toxin secretion/phage lysis holin